MRTYCIAQENLCNALLWPKQEGIFLKKCGYGYQFSSVTQSCPTLCDPMNCSTQGLPVRHQHPEFTQTHVHRVSDAIQPSHPLSSPSPPAPNPSQYQSLFQWVNSAWGGQSTGVSALAPFLPKKSQGWSPSEWTGWISLQSRGLSRVFSNTTVQKHQFFGALPSSQELCIPKSHMLKSSPQYLIKLIYLEISWSRHNQAERKLSGRVSLVGQVENNLTAMWETQAWSLGLEKIPWRRKWQRTPVFLPGKSYGRRSLVGYSPWDR